MSRISVSTVVNKGGREGHIQSLTGSLKIKTSTKRKTKNGSTDPEELFAAGFASCFNGAMIFPLKRDGLGDLERDITVEVSLNGNLPDYTTLELEVKIIGRIKGLDKKKTLEYMKETENICPYSKAVKNNVKLTLKAE